MPVEQTNVHPKALDFTNQKQVFRLRKRLLLLLLHFCFLLRCLRLRPCAFCCILAFATAVYFALGCCLPLRLRPPFGVGIAPLWRHSTGPKVFGIPAARPYKRKQAQAIKEASVKADVMLMQKQKRSDASAGSQLGERQQDESKSQAMRYRVGGGVPEQKAKAKEKLGVFPAHPCPSHRQKTKTKKAKSRKARQEMGTSTTRSPLSP